MLRSGAPSPCPSPRRGEGTKPLRRVPDPHVQGVGAMKAKKKPGDDTRPPLPSGERDGMRGNRRTGLARSLRRRSTDAEQKLWLDLRDRRLDGLKFKRQVPIGRFVVDFVCAEQRLIIEVDGGQHSRPADQSRDGERTAELEAMGYIVLRYWNNDIIENMEGALTDILAALDRPGQEPPHPIPLPAGERGRGGKGSAES